MKFVSAIDREFVICSLKKFANFTKLLKFVKKIRGVDVTSSGILLWAPYNSKLNVGEVSNFCCVI